MPSIKPQSFSHVDDKGVSAFTITVVVLLAAVVIVIIIYACTCDKKSPPRLNLDGVDEDISNPQDAADLASDNDKRNLFIGVPSDESGIGRYWDSKL